VSRDVLPLREGTKKPTGVKRKERRGCRQKGGGDSSGQLFKGIVSGMREPKVPGGERHRRQLIRRKRKRKVGI